MKKYNILILVLLLFGTFLVFQKPVLADETSLTPKYSISLLENELSEEKCEGLLGENLKKDLEFILKLMRVIGPLVVVVLTTIEFVGAVASKNDDVLKKGMSKLITRLVLVAVLFFLPMLLNILLNFLDSNYTTCIK